MLHGGETKCDVFEHTSRHSAIQPINKTLTVHIIGAYPIVQVKCDQLTNNTDTHAYL